MKHPLIPVEHVRLVIHKKHSLQGISACSSGSWIKKVVPAPHWVSNESLPRWFWTITLWAIESSCPVPLPFGGSRESMIMPTIYSTPFLTQGTPNAGGHLRTQRPSSFPPAGTANPLYRTQPVAPSAGLEAVAVGRQTDNRDAPPPVAWCDRSAPARPAPPRCIRIHSGALRPGRLQSPGVFRLTGQSRLPDRKSTRL